MRLSAAILLATLSSLSHAQEAPDSDEIEIYETKNYVNVAGRPITTRISSAPNNQHIMHLAADNNRSTFWTSERSTSSGPVWIDMDLGADQMVSAVYLTPAMYPNGASSHNIWGRTSAGEWVFITSYSGNSSDNNPIQINIFNKHTPVRYLIVETTQSPSWVAWRELRASGRLASVSGCNITKPSYEWVQTLSIQEYSYVGGCSGSRNNTYIDSDGLPVGYSTIACDASSLPYGWVKTGGPIQSAQCYYRLSATSAKVYDQAYQVRKAY